jgi:calcineurin-like phosphoesterase family protein
MPDSMGVTPMMAADEQQYKSRPDDFDHRINRHWQGMVHSDDLVVHLGDVMVGNSTDWHAIIATLPGRKVLVLGNHDFCCARQGMGVYMKAVSHQPSVLSHQLTAKSFHSLLCPPGHGCY